MKIILLTLSLFALTVFAQSGRVKSYYLINGTITATNGISYKIEDFGDDESHWTHVDNQTTLNSVNRDRVDGSDSFEDWREKFTFNQDSMLNIIRDFFTERNYTMVNKLYCLGVEDDLEEEYYGREVGFDIYANMQTGEIVHITIALSAYKDDLSPAMEVPIEVYEDLTSQIRSRVICQPTQAGREYFCCVRGFDFIITANNNP